MAYILPSLDPGHRCARGIELARRELAMGEQAMAEGNQGRARVCGRRAVGALIGSLPEPPAGYGTHAMANLRGISDDRSLPDEIRAAADRLLGGARSILNGGTFSTDPLGDAVLIIDHFVLALS